MRRVPTPYNSTGWATGSGSCRIKKGLSLEMLNWTFALRLGRSKTAPAEIQAKLGLSAMRFFYVKEMLQRLAG